MAIDLSSLWDYSKPALSEQRFQDILVTAQGDDELILRTQIARTYGIRKDFIRAREILSSIEPRIQGAGVEVQVRYALELGRTFSSATHSPESQTESAKTEARTAYMRAHDLARVAQLDDLAIDALHMMAVVDTAPADQLKWGMMAIDLLEQSSQPAAKRWEGSLRNNIGYALHLLGRYEEALLQFNLALVARQRAGNPGTIRIAYWMIAWTFRALGRIEEALEIQLRLENECEAAGEPDQYVFEELENLYRAQKDDIRADHYAARRKTIK